MNDQPTDERYTLRAEHYALKERVAVLENRLEMKLDGLRDQIKELGSRATSHPSIDSLSLAVQRMMDGMATKPSRASFLTPVALGAALAVIAMFFLQGKPW